MDASSPNRDVYLYGMTLITTSYRLEGDFPAPESYGEIIDSHRLPGGETGTCAVVLASLGLTVRLDGNYLGRFTYEELSSFFKTSSVSLDLMTFDGTFEGLEDLVFIDQTSRTSFGRFASFYRDPTLRRWNRPNADAIKSAAVAGIDPFFNEESVEAARLCSQSGTRFATVDCAAESEVHHLSDVSVISAEFLTRQYPGQDLSSLFLSYSEQTSGLVIFTFGSRDLWFGRGVQEPQSFSPYQVDVESTLGAGDSFKAGVLYAMFRGMKDAPLVRFASATAAAACSRYPIAKDPPTLERIEAIAGESGHG